MITIQFWSGLIFSNMKLPTNQDMIYILFAFLLDKAESDVPRFYWHSGIQVSVSEAMLHIFSLKSDI